MINWANQNILPIGLACILALTGYWWSTPYPYSLVSVAINEVVPPDGPIPVQVKLFRTGLCPYIIERRVYDAKGTKVHDTRRTFSTPKSTGDDAFPAPVSTTVDMAEGPGLYEVRIGSMCNPLQRVFPNYGPWYPATFEVKKVA